MSSPRSSESTKCCIILLCFNSSIPITDALCQLDNRNADYVSLFIRPRRKPTSTQLVILGDRPKSGASNVPLEKRRHIPAVTILKYVQEGVQKSCGDKSARPDDLSLVEPLDKQAPPCVPLPLGDELYYSLVENSLGLICIHDLAG